MECIAFSLDPHFSDDEYDMDFDSGPANGAEAVDTTATAEIMQDERIAGLQEVVGCNISTARHLLEVYEHCKGMALS
jgi:hypothetical protein